MIRVGVLGAAGRMGRLVARAVAEDPGLALVAAIDRSHTGRTIGSLIGRPDVDVPVSDELDRLLEAQVEVAVDFTHPDVVMDDLTFCISHALHTVVGTSGFDEDRLTEVRRMLEREGGESNVIVAPNSPSALAQHSTAPATSAGVIMGSVSDWDTMRGAAETLQRFGVPFEAEVVSAHRTQIGRAHV